MKMIQKRKLSGWVLSILLAVLLVVGYFVSGIFCLGDLSLDGIQDKLIYVFSHPLYLWANGKTLACMGVGVLIWVFLAMYLTQHYRNFQSGKEYGNEEWADVQSVNARLRNKDTKKNRILSQNLSIATEGKWQLSNNNMLVIGSSGTYKTNSVVTPNLLRCAANYIVLDVKGELMYKYGKYLKSQGYTIRCLNLKDQHRSDRYNPFLYIETEEDVIRLIATIQDALTPPDTARNDPFWSDGACLYMQSIFFYEWFVAGKEGRVGDMNQVMVLVNDEATLASETEGKQTLLQVKMDRLESLYGENPATRDYRKLKRGAEETVRSIVIIVNAMLKLFETEGLKRIFSGDDLHLREFATGVNGTIENLSGRKSALFLCVPDNDQSYNFVCSMVYTQALDLLMRMADNDFRDRGSSLPIPLEVWMDEFYAGARPYATEALMGVVRSRNISLIPILQSVAQIKSLFPGDKWQIIMDNCAVLMYLGSGSGALETHKYISELIGKMTIDTSNDGKSGQNGSVNYNRMGRELLTPAEVRRMDRHDCIIFLEGQLPVYDRKALPWEVRKGPFQEAMRLNRDGGYIHPVSVVRGYDGQMYTIREDQGISFFRTGEEMPGRKADVCLGEEEFLQLNLHPKAEMNQQEKLELYSKILQERGEWDISKNIIASEGISQDERKNQTAARKETVEKTEKKLNMKEKENVPIVGAVKIPKHHLENWLLDHAGELGEETVEELLRAMEDGLDDRKIQQMAGRPLEEMKLLHRLFLLQKNVG